ncbi:MAG: DoxX family protein [Acidobacteria bacterium]|nr:DoxX family protein [Acidobacteriota bacterium]
MLSSKFSRFQPYAIGLLRIFAAFVFVQRGLQKFGLFEGKAREFPQLLWFAGVNETIFGLLIFLGLFTRPAAILMAGQMAIAYFISHFPRGFWAVTNGGEPAVLFCFIYLFIFTAGPGKFSMDGLLARRSGGRG